MRSQSVQKWFKLVFMGFKLVFISIYSPLCFYGQNYAFPHVFSQLKVDKKLFSHIFFLSKEKMWLA